MAVIEAVEALSPKQNLELSFTFSKTNRLDHVELDLRNSHLDGPIPDVLGKLPNLRLLICSSNNQLESKRLALVIGLAVVLPIFFLFILALVFHLVRKQKTSTQGQVTAVELGGNQGVTTTGQSQEGVVSSSMSTDALTRPSLAIEYNNS
ncbi:hypothetical protein J1N35_031819 [Gossypium stocksii]|uniref:Malectin-like domain-containing protein n=1 Tax=Gossypium stocksii TaxID=47602 RepID=A0A9D3ZVG3_9ROSI|nr:hypothetical protein J1N35_031819 [Gossypium stocksii]